MNFCPHCGHNLRPERALTQGEIDAMVAVDPWAPREMREEARRRLNQVAPYCASQKGILFCKLQADHSGACEFPKTANEAALDPRTHEPRVVERVPTVTELMKPVPFAARREDFASDEAWAEFQRETRELHRRNRIDAAYHAWLLEFPIGSGKTHPSVEEVLAWHEATARVDGAANAKLLREFAEAMGVSVDGNGVIGWGTYPKPTDKELVEWARARRAAAEGSAGK